MFPLEPFSLVERFHIEQEERGAIKKSLKHTGTFFYLYIYPWPGTSVLRAMGYMTERQTLTSKEQTATIPCRDKLPFDA